MTNYQYQYNIEYQYHFGITAFVIYAAIINIPEMNPPQRRTLVSLGAAACMCISLVIVTPKIGTYTEYWRDFEDMYNQMEEILDTVPEDASVACSSHLLAHIADRDEIYDVRYHEGEGDVDYVIYDARYGVDEEQYQAYLDMGYTVVGENEDLVVILKKGE